MVGSPLNGKDYFPNGRRKWTAERVMPFLVRRESLASLVLNPLEAMAEPKSQNRRNKLTTWCNELMVLV